MFRGMRGNNGGRASSGPYSPLTAADEMRGGDGWSERPDVVGISSSLLVPLSSSLFSLSLSLSFSHSVALTLALALFGEFLLCFTSGLAALFIAGSLHNAPSQWVFYRRPVVSRRRCIGCVGILHTCRYIMSGVCKLLKSFPTHRRQVNPFALRSLRCLSARDS